MLDLISASDGAGPGAARGYLPSLTCVIRNDTGLVLPQFGIVGFNAPLITPSQNQAEFQIRPAFSAVQAAGGTFDLRWGIALGPLNPGDFGTAIVQGLACCKVNGVCTMAGPSDSGDVNALVPEDCGLARVIWQDTGSSQLAWICLG